MTDTKRVVIDIADRIAPTIIPALTQLSVGSKTAHSEVSKLQRAMRGFKRISLSAQVREFDRLAASMRKVNLASVQKSTGESKALVEAEKVAQAKARTEVATLRVVDAEAKTAITSAKLAQESAKVAQAKERATQAEIKTRAELSKSLAAEQAVEAAKSRSVTQANQAAISQQRLSQATSKTAQEASKEAKARADSVKALEQAKNEADKNLLINSKTQESIARAAKLEADKAAAMARTRQISEQTLLIEQRKIKVQRQNEAALKGMLAQTRKLSYAVRDVVRVWMFIGAVTFPIVALGAYANEYTNLNNKLQYVSDNQAHANLLFGELGQIAHRTRSSLDATISSFARFDRALRHTNVAQQEVLQMTETINKAFIVSGTTAQESASAMLQLSQAFNAGKLQGDEFRSVAENLPVAMKYFAQELGVPVSKLQDLRAEGKITSEVMLKAFASMSEEMNAAFAKTTPTIGQAAAHFNTSMIMMIGNAEKTTGSLAAVSKGIIWASNNLKTLATIAIAVSGVFVLHIVGRMVASLKALSLQVISTRAVMARLWAFLPPQVLIAAGVVTALSAAFIMLKNNAIEASEKMTEGIEAAHMSLSRMVEEQLMKHSKDIEINIGLNKEASDYTKREIEATRREIENLNKKQAEYDNLSPQVKKQMLAVNYTKQLELQKNKLIDLIAKEAELGLTQKRNFEMREEAQSKLLTSTIRKTDPTYGAEKLEGQSLDSAMGFARQVAESYYDNTLAARYEMQRNLGLLNETTEAQYQLNLATAQQSDELIKNANNAKTVRDMLQDSVKALKEAGKTHIEIGVIRMKEAGATPEEVEEYRANMKEADTRNKLSKGVKESAKTLAIYNQELDNELSRIKLLRNERESLAKVDKIADDLAKNKMKISAQERAELLTKIKLIEQLSKVQSEMDSIYDSINESVETFSAKIAASNNLLKMGAINAKDYANAIASANIEFQKTGTRPQDQATIRNLQGMGVDTSQLGIELGLQRDIFRMHQETLDEMQKAGLLSVSDYAQATFQITLGSMQNSSNVFQAGFADAYKKYAQGMETWADGISAVTTSVFTNMENALVDFAVTSKFNFREMSVSIIKDLSQILIKMGMIRLMQAAIGMVAGPVANAPSATDYGGGIPYRYDSGGFTGMGGKYEPAGIVHKNEVVFSEDDVERWGGADRVERLRLKGYSGGGVVGGGTFKDELKSSKQPISLIINIDKDGSVNVDDEDKLANSVIELIDVKLNEWQDKQSRNRGVLRK